MLTLYHGLASTCSKKVRMCLAEKGLAYESRLLNLQKYEQHDPEYLKLNPKGVVPTLVHDVKPIVESTLIVEYLDEAFPDPSLHPPDAYGRHKMRLWTKWSDDVGYNAVYVPTWEKLSRPGVSRMDEDSLSRMLARVPTAERRKRWEQTARTGFSQEEFETAYGHMRNTLSYMEKALADGPWLAGDMFTLADIAIVPFVERILDLRPETLDEVGGAPRLRDWYARMQAPVLAGRVLLPGHGCFDRSGAQEDRRGAWGNGGVARSALPLFRSRNASRYDAGSCERQNKTVNRSGKRSAKANA